MSVANENQIWFQWERCEDGYEWAEDKNEGMVLRPKSDRFVPVFPLVEDPSLFAQFSDLKAAEDFQDFAKDFGLLTSRRGGEPNVDWDTSAHSMGAAFRAWDHHSDFTTLMEFFNRRSSERSVGVNVGTVRMRLELLPKRTMPVLYLEPTNLELAMWAQFAHTVTHNKRQKRCKNPKCEKWFAAPTSRKLTCSNACKQEVHRVEKKRREQKR